MNSLFLHTAFFGDRRSHRGYFNDEGLPALHVSAGSCSGLCRGQLGLGTSLREDLISALTLLGGWVDSEYVQGDATASFEGFYFCGDSENGVSRCGGSPFLVGIGEEFGFHHASSVGEGKKLH